MTLRLVVLCGLKDVERIPGSWQATTGNVFTCCPCNLEAGAESPWVRTTIHRDPRGPEGSHTCGSIPKRPAREALRVGVARLKGRPCCCQRHQVGTGVAASPASVVCISFPQQVRARRNRLWEIIITKGQGTLGDHLRQAVWGEPVPKLPL